MEKIKYHQNGTGWDYDYNGELLDNWNPDLDYGNEYVHVYFRINTPSYHSGPYVGFQTAEDSAAWHKEASELISSFGILEDCGSDIYKVYLYAHPDNFSGIVRKNDVKRISEAISKMKLSSIRWVDIYRTIYDMGDEEYSNYLNKRKSVISEKVFAFSQTPRANKFVSLTEVLNAVSREVMLPRLNKSMDQTIFYVNDIVEDMLSKGYLKSFINENGKYIRSLNKTEQKKAKFSFDML